MMNPSESTQSKLEKFAFDMKMRRVYYEMVKQEALFRNLPNGIERSGDFIISLFDKHQIDHEKGTLALIEMTKKELAVTRNKIWEYNLRQIYLQILLFFIKPFS